MGAAVRGIEPGFGGRLLGSAGLHRPTHPPPSPVLGVAATMLLVLLLLGLPPAVAHLADRAGWDRAWYLVLIVVPVSISCRLLGTTVAFGSWEAVRRLVGWSRSTDVKSSLMAAALAFLGFAAAQGLALLALGRSVPTTATPTANFGSHHSMLVGIVSIGYSVFGAAIGEELLLRGLVQRFLLARGVASALAVAASSLLFAADHYPLGDRDPVALAGIIGVGAALGFVAWYTGRLAPAIGGHVLYNAVLNVADLF